MPSYKLIYFNMMGRAEAARILFAVAGVDFEDCRIKTVDWPLLKPKMPMGQLPVLEVDGKLLAQSQTINRFLAKQFGLAGKDDWESARCDMLVDGLTELNAYFRPWFIEQDPEKKKKIWLTLETEQIKPFLQRYEHFLEENGSEYFVGSELTWADIVLYSSLSVWGKRHPTLLHSHPKLANFVSKMELHPKLKEWLGKRPVTDM